MLLHSQYMYMYMYVIYMYFMLSDTFHFDSLCTSVSTHVHWTMLISWRKSTLYNIGDYQILKS